MLLSAGSTVLSYYVTRDKVDTWNGGSMDWFLLGFAVITPMSMSIGFAFKRREEALLDIARYKSYVYQIYLSQCLWDWKKNGVNIRSSHPQRAEILRVAQDAAAIKGKTNFVVSVWDWFDEALLDPTSAVCKELASEGVNKIILLMRGVPDAKRLAIKR